MKYQTQFIRIAATFILFVLLTATFLPTSAQTIRRVTTAGDAGADGSTWEASMTLQAALAASDSLDQVWIAGGTYKPHATDRDTTFNISAGVLVYGGFDPVVDATDTDASSRSGEATVLSGDLEDDDLTDRGSVRYAASRDDNSRTVVTLAGANVTLNGLTITAGEGGTSNSGAGLYAGTGTAGVVVQFCTFTNNGTIAGSTGRGGGAYFRESATLAGCTFTNNSAGTNGGGGTYFLAEAMLANCVFASNSGGGARLLSGGTVINSTFYNSRAGRGGGISVVFADVDPDMAGIQSNPFNLQNSILIDNTASGSSYGHQVYVGNTDTANVVNINYNLIEGGASNIVFANAPEPAVEVNNIREASNGDEATLFVSTTTGDENFLRLADNTLALNAGFNDYVNNAMPAITTDAAGNPRIQGATGRERVDLGAYESAFETFVQAPQTVTFTLDSVGVVGVELELTGETNSGLAITYTSSNANVAEVGTGEKAGKLILRAIGTATITASLGATTDFMAATTVTQTITVRNPIIRRVTTAGDAGNDGSSWANAMTLQAALSATSALRGDTVWIAGGTYNPVTPSDSTRTTEEERETTFSIQADAVVYGGFAGDEASFTPDNPTTPANEDSRAREVDGTFTNETILSGDLLRNDLAQREDRRYDASRTDNSRTVVTITGSNVTLNGLTITAGEGSGSGAGLHSVFANTSLTGCTFTSNTSGSKGGGAGFFSTATLTGCTFTNNRGRIGGGAYFASPATLTSCAFNDNRADDNGGGAYFNSRARLTACTFTGNNATNSTGGGAYFRVTATLTSCTFTNNRGRIGGGAYFASPATLTSCAFNDNRADDNGGGAYFASPATLTSCAFNDNWADDKGGGAYLIGRARLTACTFTSNGSGRFGGAIFGETATLMGCTFTNNRAYEEGGGAIFNSAALTNCVFASNSSGNGGGVRIYRNGTVINSTFYNNTADRGGGIYSPSSFGFSLQNSILIGNTATARFSASSNQIFVSGNNAIEDNLMGGDTAVVFESTTANDANFLRLKEFGPAVNAGNDDHVNNAVPPITTDAAGNPRIQGGRVDLGAYESAFTRSAQDITFMLADEGEVGENITLAATASSGLDVTFEITEELLLDGSTATTGAVATLAANTLRLTGVGTVTVMASQEGNGSYEEATAVVQELTVSKQTQNITFTSDTTGTVGMDIELMATASSGLPVTFAITEGDVLATLVDTTLTLTGVGEVEITATQAGNANYAAATQTQTITVSAAPLVAIRRVTTTGAGTGDGSSWANAMMLQAALSASTTAGDQVWIAEGTYKPHADDRAATFSISAGVLVYGGFAGTEADDFDPANNLRTGSETILSGDLLDDDIERPAAGSDQTAYDASRDDNSYTVVTISGADLTLDGLVISGGERGTEEDNFGNTKYYGAGLYGGFGTGVLTLQNIILMSNNAEHEGGGAYFKSTVSVTNATFTNNTATEDGGGAYFKWITTITGSTFSNNRTSDGPGGGAYFGSVNITDPNISSVATVTSSTFTNNSVSDDRGGGAYFDGSATVTSCTFSNNSSTGTLFTSGGGAYFDDDATVVNCVFANNRADGNGGGAYFSLFSFGNINSTVTNSTFYSNSGNQGGGIYANYGVTFGSNTTNINLRNNILMNNTANAGAAELYIGTQNASQTASIDNNLIQGGNNGPRVLVITDDGVSISNIVDASDAAVVFASTDSMNANYLRLKAGSPALNVGNNSYIPAGITTDAAGNARIQDGTVDLGAYEGVSSVDAGTVELGIEDAVNDLVLYPNPTSGKLHFSEQVEEFHLYSAEGRLLDTWKNVRSADLTALPSGRYFVEVIRDGQSVGYRIVRK